MPNNSLNPTLASESFIIKVGGFCYLACSALASGGLIRALGVSCCRKLRLLDARAFWKYRLHVLRHSAECTVQVFFNVEEMFFRGVMPLLTIIAHAVIYGATEEFARTPTGAVLRIGIQGILRGFIGRAA